MKQRANKLLYAMVGIVVYLATTADSCNCNDRGQCYDYGNGQIQASWNFGVYPPTRCNVDYWSNVFLWTTNMRGNGWKVKLKCTQGNNFCWEKTATPSDVVNNYLFLYNVPSSGDYTLYITVISPNGCELTGQATSKNGCIYTQENIGYIY